MLTRSRLAAGVARARMRQSTDRRSFLLRLLPKNSVGVEVGVWRGDFSSRLLRHVEPSVLHMVDSWEFRPDPSHEGAWYGGAIAKSQRDMDRLYGFVRARFVRARRFGQVVLHRLPSVDAAAAFADDSLDWVYIDGDHTLEGVREDLRAWVPKVKPGGIVAGDDYGVGSWWSDGVVAAVAEYVAAHPEYVVLARGQQFILLRNEGADTG